MANSRRPCGKKDADAVLPIPLSVITQLAQDVDIWSCETRGAKSECSGIHMYKCGCTRYKPLLHKYDLIPRCKCLLSDGYLEALMLAIFIAQSTFHVHEVAIFCACQFTVAVIQVMLDVNCVSSLQLLSK